MILILNPAGIKRYYLVQQRAKEGQLVVPFVTTFIRGLIRVLPTKYGSICALQIIALALRVPVFLSIRTKADEYEKYIPL